MPELPDLEVYAKNLRRELVGKKLTRLDVYKESKANVSKKELESTLLYSHLIEIIREGKELIFVFSNNNKVSIHLMLEGRFDLLDNDESIQFKSFVFGFDESINLIVSDPRGWAKLEFAPRQTCTPDALSHDFSTEYLTQKIAEKKTKNIKSFLLDQNIVRGIGNAYSDEILWHARISPESKCGKLPGSAIGQLFDSIKFVLMEAVGEILKIEPNAINGEVRDFMKVHNKIKKQTATGYMIKTKKIASKTTYFTEEQVLYI